MQNRRKFLFTLMPLTAAIIPSVNAYPNPNLVAFNTQSFKYHKPNCKWARKCTQNCIFIARNEAIKRGGVPCNVCGG